MVKSTLHEEVLKFEAVALRMGMVLTRDQKSGPGEIVYADPVTQFSWQLWVYAKWEAHDEVQKELAESSKPTLQSVFIVSGLAVGIDQLLIMFFVKSNEPLRIAIAIFILAIVSMTINSLKQFLESLKK